MLEMTERQTSMQEELASEESLTSVGSFTIRTTARTTARSLENGANANHTISRQNTSQASANALERSLQPILRWMQWFGLFVEDWRKRQENQISPFYNQISVENQRFQSWLCLTRILQCLVCLLSWLNVLRFAVLFFIQHAELQELEVFVMLAVAWSLQVALQATACCCTLNSTGSTNSYRKFMDHHSESFPPNDSANRKFTQTRIVRPIFLITLISVIVNFSCVLYLLFSEYQDIVEVVIYPLPNTIAIKIVYTFFHIFFTTAWLLPVAFFCSIACILIHQADKLKDEISSLPDLSEMLVAVQEDYTSLCMSVEAADRFLRWLCLSVMVTNIPSVIFALYQLVFTPKSGYMLAALSFWFACALAMLTLVAVLGATLCGKMESFVEVFESKKAFSSALSLESNTQLMLLLFKLNKSCAGITAGGIVHINKSLIVTVVSVVVTYFVLLYQLEYT